MADFRRVPGLALPAAPRSSSALEQGRRAPMKRHARLAIALLLLVGTDLFLPARNHGEVFPPRKPLSDFPEQFGSWTGTSVEIGKDIRDILGPGDFLLRVYRNQRERQP